MYYDVLIMYVALLCTCTMYYLELQHEVHRTRYMYIVQGTMYMYMYIVALLCTMYDVHRYIVLCTSYKYEYNESTTMYSYDVLCTMYIVHRTCTR